MTDRITLTEFREIRRRGGSTRPRTVQRDYKAEFLDQLRLLNLPAPVAEVRFHGTRQWRFDWAYLDRKIAIEYQGGNYTGRGGHNTVKGLRNDYAKFTEASLLGWTLILIDSETVASGKAAEWVEWALGIEVTEILTSVGNAPAVTHNSPKEEA